jgi:hypothetical protein
MEYKSLVDNWHFKAEAKTKLAMGIMNAVFEAKKQKDMLEYARVMK